MPHPVGQLVVVRVAEGVEECAGPEVRAADAENDDAVDLVRSQFVGRQDRGRARCFALPSVVARAALPADR